MSYDNLPKIGFRYKPTPRKAWVAGSGKATVRYGALPLMPGGHGWKNYLPPHEAQSHNDIEPCDCTIIHSLRAWITAAKRQGFSLPDNASERFSAVMAGLRPPGGDPYVSNEAIRRFGMVHDDALPFDDTIKSLEDFYHPDPMLDGYKTEGKKVVQRYDLGHQYLFNDSPFRASIPGKQAIIKAYLERGPVCASVYAWKNNGEYYYKDQGDQDAHWIQIVDYKEGEYWEIDDSYTPYLKKLDWNFNFQTACVYFIKANETGIAPDDRDRLSVLLRQAKEWCLLILAKLKKENVMPPVQVIDPEPPALPTPTKPDFPPMIVKWADAIAIGEGAKPSSNNPGNLKYASLTALWGATRGRAALDGGYFCQFATPREGAYALCSFLMLGAEDQLRAFHKPEQRTLTGFMEVFAGGPPQGYIDDIVKHLGVSPQVQISSFLI